ncbi:MAG: hypothetical protein R3E32_26410 [Chitinophagales bacterium]
MILPYRFKHISALLGFESIAKLQEEIAATQTIFNVGWLESRVAEL